MRWLYYALQIAVFVGVFQFSLHLAEQGTHIGGPAIGFISIGFAAVATAIVYWSIRGIKRLLGYPPEGKIVTPPGAFDNLRRRNPNQIEH